EAAVEAAGVVGGLGVGELGCAGEVGDGKGVVPVEKVGGGLDEVTVADGAGEIEFCDPVGNRGGAGEHGAEAYGEVGGRAGSLAGEVADGDVIATGVGGVHGGEGEAGI